MNALKVKIKKLLANRIFIWGSLSVLVLIAVLVYFFYPSSANSDLIEVKRGTIIQEVDVTGTTRPAKNVEMSFYSSGKISSVNVSVGDHVYTGQVLASLDVSDLYAQLAQAEASLVKEKIKLAKLKPEIGNSSVVSDTQIAIANALADWRDEVLDAYLSVDSELVSRIDKLFFNANSTIGLSPTFGTTVERSGVIYSVTNVTNDTGVNDQRLALRTEIKDWVKLNNDLSSAANIKLASEKAKQAIGLTQTMVSRMIAILGRYSLNNSTTEIYNEFKTSLATAQTNLSTALASLKTAEQAYATANSSVSSYEIAWQQATVDNAQAQVNLVRAQIAKNAIIAPQDGLITRQDIVAGETSVPGANVITIMSEANFEVEVDVPEVDVGKVKLGDKVNITLDAFSGESWTGHVTYIEPAETIVDGVVSYKTKISFDQEDDRLKSGLTANLEIITMTKEQVLILPQYAIEENDQGSAVRQISANGSASSTAVKLGIRSQTGEVEIISGLAEGDLVQNVGLKK